MRLLALMPVKNETSRYLDAALAWLAPTVDGILVFDDRSDDDTWAVAMRRGAHVAGRHENDPSFLEHEGAFRQAAWEAFEATFNPEDGDWVLTIDADEFMVAEGDVRRALQAAVNLGEAHRASGILISRPEVFDANGPLVRTDGYWGRITCHKLFRYRPGGELRQKAMGCGAEPTYVAQGRLVRDPNLTMLHYGYAEETDRVDKHDRYTSLPDHGHNEAHIRSILAVPKLELWRGPVPKVYRGVA